MSITTLQALVLAFPVTVASIATYRTVTPSSTPQLPPPTVYLSLNSSNTLLSRYTDSQQPLSATLEQQRSNKNTLNQQAPSPSPLHTQPSQNSSTMTAAVQSKEPIPQVPITSSFEPLPIAPAPVPTSAADYSNPTIRVLVDSGSNQFSVGSNTTAIFTDSQGRSLGGVNSMTPVTVQMAQGGVRVGGMQVTDSVTVQSHEPSGYVFLNDRWYRGRIALVPVDGTLWVINYLPLEDYLPSVVGAEMPSSWNPEALKSQAIAARSYALAQMFRPHTAYYDVTPTERHQVYKGVASETAQSQLAVESTRGLILSYNGGVVESMYASTDEVIRQHHRNVQSMSQTGANNLANQGFDFSRILAHYYPGTAIVPLQ